MIRPIHWFAISALFYVLYGMGGPHGFAQTPTATSQGQLDSNGSYIVAPGDTLYGISARYGFTVPELIDANSIGPGLTLYVGQPLVFPQGEISPAADNAQVSTVLTYSVSAGDTLFSIAKANGAAVDQLSALNGISDSAQIYVGQVLKLPARNTQLSGLQPSGQTISQIPKTHSVTAGQTLFSISRQYSVEVDQLVQINQLKDSGHIFVGQILQIPHPLDASVSNSSDSSSIALALPSEMTLDRQSNSTSDNSNTADSRSKDVSTPTIANREIIPSSGPVIRQVAVSSVAATPLMLPSPPPRRGSKFYWPARGKILTRYGTQQNGQISDGIEIKVDPGSNILAADDGVVAFAGSGISGYGYLVLIKHSDDYYTAYGQNSSVSVARGDIIRRGDLIARAGNSTVGVNGKLHFEVRYRQEPVNPIAYMVN